MGFVQGRGGDTGSPPQTVLKGVILTTKKEILAIVSSLCTRVRYLEEREQKYIELATQFEASLNIIRSKQSEIAAQYDNVLRKQREILDSHDVMLKRLAQMHAEIDGFTVWMKNLGSRVQQLEQD